MKKQHIPKFSVLVAALKTSRIRSVNFSCRCKFLFPSALSHQPSIQPSVGDFSPSVGEFLAPPQHLRIKAFIDFHFRIEIIRSQKEHPGPIYEILEDPQDANKVCEKGISLFNLYISVLLKRVTNLQGML